MQALDRCSEKTTGERPCLTNMAETMKDASEGRGRCGRKGDAHPANKAEGDQAAAPVASGQEAEAAAPAAPGQEAEGGAGQGAEAAAPAAAGQVEAEGVQAKWQRRPLQRLQARRQRRLEARMQLGWASTAKSFVWAMW